MLSIGSSHRAHSNSIRLDRGSTVIRWVTSLLTIGLLTSAGCGGRRDQPRRVLKQTAGSVTIHGDVWADNWFALYLGEDLLIEDSVSITTERSFNAESFSFKADYPIVLNFVVKDFKQDESGLEYIGTRRQQLGDGGFIAQFKDATSGKLLAFTDSNWRCMVLHRGPLDENCATEQSPVAGEGACAFTSTEEPESWKSQSFSTDDWKRATEFSARDVQPKDGYDQISWDSNTRLIWSDDLKKDNTILFRLVIDGP